MSDRLTTYRKRRDPGRTPEPVPPRGPLPRGRDDTFVIQQHHARRLHWDLRLERNGVLVSWALPRGVPRDPKRNHLAVHTEDHPLEYASFAGEIPAGEYGGGRVKIFDRGTYETEKWLDDEVIVVLHGSRVAGRYVLFQTRGKDWMIHRMDPPDPTWQPMPEAVRPMLATTGELPRDGRRWAFEMNWSGRRAIAYAEAGRLRLTSRTGEDVTADFPELRGLGDALAGNDCVLDGEIVAFDDEGRVSAAALRRRDKAGRDPGVPVAYFVYDLLHLDGRPVMDESYVERRRMLDALAISGPRWQVPPYFTGGGSHAVRASREQGLKGVLAKRLASTYQPGRRTGDWLKVVP